RWSRRGPRSHAGPVGDLADEGGTGELPDDRREEAEPVQRRAGERVDCVLRVGHDPDDVAGLIADRGDPALRAVWVVGQVARHDPALSLELVERPAVRYEASLAVLDRDDDLLT